MVEYLNCCNCNLVLVKKEVHSSERCEACGSVMCLDCSSGGCPVCRTERNFILKVPKASSFKEVS